MKPGWKTSEFWLTLLVTGFAMWAGSEVLLDTGIELERFLTVVATISGAAALYAKWRTDLKRSTDEPDGLKK